MEIGSYFFLCEGKEMIMSKMIISVLLAVFLLSCAAGQSLQKEPENIPVGSKSSEKDDALSERLKALEQSVSSLRSEVANLGSRLNNMQARSSLTSFKLPKEVSLCGEVFPLEDRNIWENLDREFLLALSNEAQVLLWMKRARRYFPPIEKKLKEMGLPDDLKYVTITESSLRPEAVSSSGAGGIWQFIPSTGEKYGMRRNRSIDERFDFFKATEGALSYLKYLYEEFKSWTLSMAAYNAGENRVRKEVDLQKTGNYFYLDLPLETERYVYKIAVPVACQTCHTTPNYASMSTACASCHLADFNKTANPNHTAAGFPQDCTVCHTTVQWLGATFNHGDTKFPLTGAHVPVACQTCHTTPNYASTSTACASCHLTNFNSTTNPNHVLAGFGQDCSPCHTTVQWTGATFNHGNTKFPLTGTHVTVTCQTCHTSGSYASTPTTCVSCHLTDFNGANSPNHTTAGFPQDCSTCHTTVQWMGAVFDHSKTGFVLTGVHLQTACALCHPNGRFVGTPTTCSSCHLADFQGTNNPNHTAAGFPQDCSLCHSAAGWPGAQYTHPSAKFTLTGFHITLNCSACHANGQYATLSTTCVTCHLSDYNGTTSPTHATYGFPQDCTVCHATTAWTPASFSHATTNFALTGAHVSVTCVSCHIGGVFKGTPTTCYACHKTDYTGITNPNHVAAGFPTTCSTCHTTTVWTGATFTHSQFPINSGHHARAWTSCADCHTNANDYKVFSCTGCHQHDKASVDSHHRSVRNYVYNSANCYSCHPNGSAG